MKTILVVDRLSDWKFDLPELEVITGKDYLSNSFKKGTGRVRICNVCNSFNYQKLGYYVSLIAAARGDKPTPSLTCIEDIKNQGMIRLVNSELEEVIQKSLESLHSNSFVLSMYFGKNLAKRHEKLATGIYRQFPAPFMQAKFTRTKGKWTLTSIRLLPPQEIPDDHLEFVREETRKYLSRKTAPEMQAKMTRFDLAILVNPEELKPPSNAKALQKFAKAAQEMGMSCEFITKGDMSRLGEFDGLFIRETTSVNHHTYRMARRAHANGLIVIDDPQSILRCCNKVFLHELMEKHKIPVPKTTIIDKEHLDEIALTMTYPCVLKRPDSAFSQGVIKVSSPKDFLERCNEMLEQSDLILAQEYLPTDFDWRVGVLDGEPLYCCRYFMVKNHWQICKATKTGKMREGDSAGVPLDKAPPGLLKLASRAANLIGDGLYGVDIKEINGSFYVMEINDNPSIDAGFEDAVIKDELYRKIIHSLCVRMEEGQEKARKQIPKKHGAPTH